jgi:hypothetical protein
MNRILRAVFLVFFITHVPITLCMDAQIVLKSYFPRVLQEVIEWYVSTYGDFLIANPPVWFKSIVALEIIFQLPFFFVAIYALIRKRNWIRIPAIVYGAHVSTTVWPILAEICVSSVEPSVKATLLMFYTPYFVIPLTLMVVCCAYEHPFGKNQSQGKKAA